MSNIDKILGELMRIDGASGAAVVDADSGMVLGMSGNPSFSLEYAGAGNSEVVRAKLRTMSNLGITDTLEDILITLSNQYHLIRVLETPGLSTLFVYLVFGPRTCEPGTGPPQAGRTDTQDRNLTLPLPSRQCPVLANGEDRALFVPHRRLVNVAPAPILRQ
ncbi:hypothetical protein [Rhodococcus erythropolis]|uniref:hypothetical protein n=1 Tax=Rhodococcus erythropolis TaxID=1833 RepID=UPI00380AE0CD